MDFFLKGCFEGTITASGFCRVHGSMHTNSMDFGPKVPI